MDLPVKKYQIIYADPPWRFGTWGKTGWKAPQRHYSCMSIKDIINIPVNSLADNNCVLFMWATYPCLEQSFKVISGWGFSYSTVAFTWIKTTENGLWHIGLGYWTRANPELCLLATKGSLKRIDKGIRNLIISPVLEHSHKPSIVRTKIVELMGDLPRIELFARKKEMLFDAEGFDGWDVWGNESGAESKARSV